MPASLVWFRNDLRLADNPALIAGLGSGRPVVPVYVLDEETDGIRPAGAASRWWLHQSLHAREGLYRRLAPIEAALAFAFRRYGPCDACVELPAVDFNADLGTRANPGCGVFRAKPILAPVHQGRRKGVAVR